MSIEVPLSIIASMIAVLSAILSMIKVYSKKKAEDSFIFILQNEVDTKNRIIWAKTLKHYLKNPYHDNININILYRDKNLQLLDREISKSLEKLSDDEKRLIIEGIKQQSEKGRLAYIEKLLSQSVINTVK